MFRWCKQFQKYAYLPKGSSTFYLSSIFWWLMRCYEPCYSWFYHSKWITLVWHFPCPSADSLDPLDHFLSFDVSLTIPKNMWKMIHATFKPIIAYIHGFDPWNLVHQDVCIMQILLEFSLTWIRLTWLLAFHIPWDRSDLTFHYPFEKIYKEPLGTLKHKRELRAKKL